MAGRLLGQLAAAATVPTGSQAERRITACEIRVLEAIDELVESYRLRYEVYGALGYIEPNRSRLEIDPYDPYAVPFGAFDAESGALIGTLRLVTNEPKAGYVQAVCQVLASSADPELVAQASRPRQHALPSILSPEVASRIAEFNRDHFPVEELSRTIVRPGHRGGGVSRGLMEFGLAWAAQRGPRVLVGGCLGEHVPMYARYGYVQLPRTELDFFDSVRQVAHAVVCRTDVLPEPTRTHVDELVPRLRGEARRRLRERAHPTVYRLASDGTRVALIEEK